MVRFRHEINVGDMLFHHVDLVAKQRPRSTQLHSVPTRRMADDMPHKKATGPGNKIVEQDWRLSDPWRESLVTFRDS